MIPGSLYSNCFACGLLRTNAGARVLSYPVLYCTYYCLGFGRRPMHVSISRHAVGSHFACIPPSATSAVWVAPPPAVCVRSRTWDEALAPQLATFRGLVYHPPCNQTHDPLFQVAALGKEVIQRAEACAEARKLHAALRKQVEVARRARARNLDSVDVACRTLIAKAGDEVQVREQPRLLCMSSSGCLLCCGASHLLESKQRARSWRCPDTFDFHINDLTRREHEPPSPPRVVQHLFQYGVVFLPIYRMPRLWETVWYGHRLLMET